MNAINIDRRINFDRAHAQYVATMGISITFLGCHGAALKDFITTEKHFKRPYHVKAFQVRSNRTASAYYIHVNNRLCNFSAHA